MSAKDGDRRLRLRTLVLAVMAMSLALAYGESYYRLSRRGLAEARLYTGLPGFLYVPWEDAKRTENLSWHYALALFYAPVNWLDRALIRSDAVPVFASCVMWRLSG